MKEPKYDLFRGHKIKVVYCDTGELVAENWQKRPCGHCDKHNTPEGHDGCLGTLPGVMNACCGHGEEAQAYVQFWGGKDIRGKKALKWIKKYKKP